MIYSTVWVGMIPLELRKKLFEIALPGSSPDFSRYLRAYETLPRPVNESFEISCELINGKRVDQMRLAILGLQRHDVLQWLNACGRHIPSIEGILLDSALDACFGIGLADYPLGQGLCRMKVYHNTWGETYSQVKKFKHLRQLFELLEIKESEFIKDWELFRKVDISGIDWDGENRATIKVYYGPFYTDDLFGRFCDVFPKEDLRRYDDLREKSLLGETCLFCAKYNREGRSIRTDIRYRTTKVAAYLKDFDHLHEVSRFFLDYYKIFPGLRLEFISIQWNPVIKKQFYFLLMN